MSTCESHNTAGWTGAELTFEESKRPSLPGMDRASSVTPACEVFLFDEDSDAACLAWLDSVCQTGETQPPERLFTLFSSRQTTVKIANQANNAMNKVFDNHAFQKGNRHSQANVLRYRKMSLYLYHRVLEGVLTGKDGAGMPHRHRQAVLENDNFLLSLIQCAVEIVAWGAAHMAFPQASHIMGCELQMVDLFDAVNHFLLHLRPASAGDVSSSSRSGTQDVAPECLINYLLYVQLCIVEEAAFVPGSSLYTCMIEGGGGFYRLDDYTLVQMLIKAVSKLATRRTLVVSEHLLHACPEAALQLPQLPQVAAQLMDRVLEDHLQLVFCSAHLSNLVACVVFGIAKAHDVTLSFRAICKEICRVSPHHDPALFKHIEFASEDGLIEVGDTKQLYNDIFLPVMHEEMQQLARAQEEGGSKAAAVVSIPLAKSKSPLCQASAKRKPLRLMSNGDAANRSNTSRQQWR